MFSAKKTLLTLCSIILTLNLTITGGTLTSVYAEALDDTDSVSDTDSVNIAITPGEDYKAISPYIYGMNDVGSISDVSASVIKQKGAALSTYNWETNYANFGADSHNENDISLVKAYAEDKQSRPALYTENLVEKSKKYSIPMKLVTLPMMGYAAADSFGVVPQGMSASRFYDISFSKGDSYLLEPNTFDNKVYIDEYLFYLAAIYGYTDEGGISGYFLDSEPELWNKKFPTLNLEPVTASNLINRSTDLAKTVKDIDPTTQVFGPSVKNISAYVNLNNSDDWDSYSSEYSWFIDYYLSEFSKSEQNSGVRLLDVLDLHYITEAHTMVNTSVIVTNDELSNKERMQAVRTLWDSNYTENSSSVLLHKQHTPLIPTVQASIRMFYPGTKLSFSEYNFGGGSDISGGIAEADTLGIFASNDVYMACLLPNSDNCTYQKSAINLYTNYDGKGSKFGNTLVKSDNGGDYMSSVYSAVGSELDNVVKSVIINKNYESDKKALIKIDSPVTFSSAKVYCFDKSSSKIRFTDNVTNIKGNDFEYILSPMTVYMFEFYGNDTIEEIQTEKETTDNNTSETGSTVTDSGSSEVNPVQSAEVSASNSEEQTGTQLDGSVSGSSQQILSAVVSDGTPDNEQKVPTVFKIIVSGLAVAVVIAMIYIFVFDRKKTK